MHLAAAGGSLNVIKYLLPLFGERVHEKTNSSYTVLHWAAQNGHCQVARYLITELKLDPQDRDKVCGCQGTVLVSECKVQVGLCSEAYAVTKQVTWTRLCNVYVQSCVVPAGSCPTLCLLFLVW